MFEVLGTTILQLLMIQDNTENELDQAAIDNPLYLFSSINSIGFFHEFTQIPQ